MGTPVRTMNTYKGGGSLCDDDHQADRRQRRRVIEYCHARPGFHTALIRVHGIAL